MAFSVLYQATRVLPYWGFGVLGRRASELLGGCFGGFEVESFTSWDTELRFSEPYTKDNYSEPHQVGTWL